MDHQTTTHPYPIILMTDKKVTVFLTSYNHAKYLRESIDSVLNQTYSEFELVIVDDASTDGSWEIIQSYSDSRIQVFRSDVPTNVEYAIKKIAEMSKREYVAIHHSDDVWEPEKLEKEVAFLDTNPQIGAVFSWAQIIDEDGHPFQDQDHFYYKIFEQPNRTRHEWLNYFFYHGNALCHPSILIRSQCYSDVGSYRSGLAQIPDFDMWIRLCMKYEIHVLPEKLVRFRVRSGEMNVSGNRLDNRIRWQFEYLQVLNNYKQIPTFDELKKVFPVAEDYARLDGTDLRYLLGMIALDTKPNKLAELFGLTILFQVLNDPVQAKRVKEIYGFGHVNFTELTAKHDTFSINMIEDLSAQLAEQKKIVQEIKSGTTWKIYQIIIKVRLALIPSGSRMERFIRLLIQIGMTLYTEGTRSFLNKTKNKFRQIIHRAKRIVISLASSKRTSQKEEVFVPINEDNVLPVNIQAKIIAFYLPQFHPIPENDEWWGKGFTEWANVSKAVPNFVGHYQPHLPGELGYYDLRLPEVQEQQVELAEKYGIYGFCFYYYWFAGKRLLEQPLNQYLTNSHISFPFCLCWANENWTRRWDGAEHDILIAQDHTEEQHLHFIRDISRNFSDPRYIRVNGKPMLLVYRVNLLPDPQKAVDLWRMECQKLGIGDIYLVAVQNFGITDPQPFGFDAAVEFPPSNLSEVEISRKSVKITNPKFKGRIFDYDLASHVMLEKKHGDYTYFKTVMPAWDNTARKQNDSHIFINSSPTAYKTWLEKVVAQSKKTLSEDKRFVFVNAWNEWAEGTHLEPDKKYGYAYLQATADAITKRKPVSAWTILFVSHDANKGGAQQVLINIVNWFTQRTNITVKVLCLNGGEWLYRFTEIADTLVLSELGPSSHDDELLEQIKLFCDGTPDLIYGNTVAAGSAYTWLYKLNVPILTHFHELETSIRKYGGAWFNDVLKLSSQFIACSKAVQNNLVDNHAVSPEKISTVYESIESKQAGIQGDKAKKDIRRKLGLEQNKTIVFGCGIGMPFRKGADLFIQLGEKLLQMGYENFHLYWIGGFDLSYYDDVHGIWKNHYAKLKNHNLKKHVTFLGMKANPSEYLICGDIFVLPSREDPFPLVALEAADCGLPIVCFDKAGGMPDFVGENAGFIVPQEDLDAMAQKLIELIEHKELRQKLGRQARKNLIGGFTTEQTTPNILSICRKVAGKKPAVSVIVPNFNHAPYLEQRLNSIFSQSFRDFDVVLLDDASSDNSIEKLQKYAHHADVQFIRNETNSGSPFRQWLKGMDIAKSDILWVAESDDSCDPDFLKTLLPAFMNPRVKLAYANSYIIDENDNIIGDYINTEYLSSLSKEKWLRNYKNTAEQEINDGLGVKNTILNISAVLMRRFEMDMGFRNSLENMRITGDWYFIVHAIKDGFISYDSKKLNSHRRHSNSVIAQTVNENKVQEFFKEFFMVQDYIVKSYNLTQDFPNTWEGYIRKQWSDFTNDQSFDEISNNPSFKQLKQAITMNTGHNNAGKSII